MEVPPSSISNTQSSEPGADHHHNPPHHHEGNNTELVDLDKLSLPTEVRGFLDPILYFYNSGWYPATVTRLLVSSKNRPPFQAQNTDIILASRQKSGTTWLKALAFATLNREKHPIVINGTQIHHHPLVTSNPHELVPSFERFILNPESHWFTDICCKTPPPRLYASHLPFHVLPESVKNSCCKFIYICRDPLDTLVSMWHFACKEGEETEEESGQKLEKMVDMFCTGRDGFGPHWDHVLSYWNKKMSSNRVLFLRYEEMKRDPISELRKFAEFVGYPFTSDEEQSGVIEGIVKLCSLKSLKNMEVNKTGSFNVFVRNDKLFRKGEVGDWMNHLTPSMADRMNNVLREKFKGTGFDQL